MIDDDIQEATSVVSVLMKQTTTDPASSATDSLVRASVKRAPNSAPASPVGAGKRFVELKQQHQLDCAPQSGVAPPIPRRNTAWDGINWSRGSNNKRSAESGLSNWSSSSSDEESSRASIDLQEDLQHQPHDVELGLPPPVQVAGGSEPNLFLPPYQRRRTSTMESLRQAEVAVINEEPVHEHLSDEDNHQQRPVATPSRSLMIFRYVMPRTRRNLLFLFMIALYTTVGFTNPTLTNFSRDDDTFLQVSTESLVNSEDEQLLQVDPVVLPEQQSLAIRQRKVIGNRLSFARKNINPQLVYRKQEVSDFYHQQALKKDDHWFSWYLSCGALVAVALWAWRERRTSSPSEQRLQ